ncbi:hypothetical protein SKAU_G00036140 [Synaphobranchus kaupii]|uniref:Uncharacterized protein n=1 Tax=Synaphobranchus kaupii TaxID=118154 RepID=A0A9Q1GG58_SYNKA|nr:hypothetical protein SKAU_G00036140 [Synaphobranchus kaupii]
MASLDYSDSRGHRAANSGYSNDSTERPGLRANPRGPVEVEDGTSGGERALVDPHSCQTGVDVLWVRAAVLTEERDLFL